MWSKKKIVVSCVIIFIVSLLWITAIISSQPDTKNANNSNVKNQTSTRYISPTPTQISLKVSPSIIQTQQEVLGSESAVITTAPKCKSTNGLPDSSCTPGVIDPRVTQENILDTICKSGYTQTVRPSTSYTNNLKTEQIKLYGYLDTNLHDYEEDHLISLELGGSPTDPKNLWPEPGASPNPKDKIENLCHKLVCSGDINLSVAQEEIATNWHTACQFSSSTTISLPTQILPTNTSIPQSTSTLEVIQNPVGATALCNDGTYSYAAHHQGACSHHGGVREFY